MVARHLADYDTRPVEIVDGEGVYLIDVHGKRYIDFLAGWCVGNVGWKRREIEYAIGEESRKGVYVPPMFSYSQREAFAALLAGIAPSKELRRAFRCTSGSEAVELAIKCARAATRKPMIVSVDGVFHGHTYGAAALGNACTEAMAPCPPGFLKIPLPHPRYGASPETALAEFEKILATRNDIAAFMSEPVFSNAGVIVPPEGFYREIEAMCRKRGILFIMDEVATGFGRCGKMFASELWGIEPDIVCLGKGITGGYASLGAMLATEAVFERSRGIPLYSTFGWLPNDLAAAMANVKVIIAERLWKNAERVGFALYVKCKTLESLPNVAEVRGAGMLLGVEIKNPKTGLPDFNRAVAVQDACAKLGLLLETADHALFISPPLVMTEAQAMQGFALLERALKENAAA